MIGGALGSRDAAPTSAVAAIATTQASLGTGEGVTSLLRIGTERCAKSSEEINRQREHDGRVLFDADLDQRLQIPQGDRDRFAVEHRRRLCQLRRRLELAFRRNDLRASLAFSLGL